MNTRIQPAVVRLAGTFLLVLLTLTASAQRNEVLPTPNVDPSTGQFIPREPVQLHPDLDGLRVDVDFDGLVLRDIVTWLQ